MLQAPAIIRRLRPNSSPTEAAAQALAQIGQEIAEQASFLAYIDVFWTLSWLAFAMVPLALLLRAKRGGAAPAH